MSSNRPNIKRIPANSASISLRQAEGSKHCDATIDFNVRQILRGYSAYEIAVQNGFEGTEEEWLASLVGTGMPDSIILDGGDASGLEQTEL